MMITGSDDNCVQVVSRSEVSHWCKTEGIRLHRYCSSQTKENVFQSLTSLVSEVRLLHWAGQKGRASLPSFCRMRSASPTAAFEASVIDRSIGISRNYTIVLQGWILYAFRDEVPPSNPNSPKVFAERIFNVHNIFSVLPAILAGVFIFTALVEGIACCGSHN